MPQIKCNWVDILFVICLIRVCYKGAKTGFLSEFFRSLGLLTAFIFSFNSYTLLANFLSSYIKWPNIRLDVLSFGLIFLLVLLIFKLISFLIDLLLGTANIPVVSKIMGFVLAFGRGILLIGLIYMWFANMPFQYLSNSARDRSFSGKYVSKVAPFVYKVGISLYPWNKIETPLVVLLERGESE